ncbi:MAG: sulfite exporter TauE/SafE family protein [Methanosarcinales archaeon]|nr:sulfite exporter TauE/SafE family protein [ANME-2 cluster archaeon]MDF1530958.1 sulfite exporter TauE/SafE family protein [ANME-2 cluster archaeon]MDW7775097.1 sulfite exporter TauE/SafE family protein [Methanosarcinales archaeon]
MNIDLTYWYLFPAGLVIATLAMSAGISGANFWIPVYLICVKLDPRVTFWLALITMIFGFGSGVVRNIYQGTVNWYLVRQYLIPTIPGAVIGALLTSYVNGEILVFIFGTFILIYGSHMLKSCISSPKAQIRHEKVFWGIGFLAGFMKGLIATGLGKLIVPGMWNHKKVRHPSEVIGSATVIIFIVNVVAALTRMNHEFMGVLTDNTNILSSVLVFVLPSVVIGGQIGPRVIKDMNAAHLKLYISVLLICVSLLIFSRLLL